MNNFFLKNLQTNSSREMEPDEQDNAIIETCAVALASLDRRACARAQIQDANTILEQLVLPISFPWSQCKDILFKPLPRDIDEMSIIMNGDEDNSVIALNSETFRALNSAGIPKRIPISTSRTGDPGVIELQTYSLPSASRLRRFKQVCSTGLRVQDRRHDDAMVYGERSLQMYHEVQLKKRRREEFDDRHTTKRLISFRVGCASSRSTIFSPSELNNSPLFLQAVYPKYIQDGAKRFGLEAYEEGSNLGTYNSRPLPPKDTVLHDPTSKNRFFVGRTRLVWSEKERSKSIRSSYCSILTQQRLEGNTFKRPLSIKVGIRINGVLVSARQSQESVLKLGATVLPVSKFSHSMKSVNDALDLACSVQEKQTNLVNQSNDVDAPHDYSQCNLNLPKYITEIANDQKYLSVVDGLRRPLSIQREFWHYRSKDVSAPGSMLYRLYGDDTTMEPNKAKSDVTEWLPDGVELQYQSKLQFKLDIVPPRLDCLPTEDGLIHVTCTVPGTIALSHEETYDAIATLRCSNTEQALTLSLLISVLASEIDRCPACWNYLVGDAICRICPYGSLIHRNDKCIWLNTISSIWSNLDSINPAWMRPIDDKNNDCDSARWYNDESICHLCTTGTMGPVTVSSCAAEGCSVRFHPICAIVASASNEVQYKHGAGDRSRHKSVNHHHYEKDDSYLCTQYTQSLLESSFTMGQAFAVATTKTPSRTSCHKTAVVPLPIMFCPYHNPKRCREFYGLYPQACYLDHGTIRIPPQRDYATNGHETTGS